MWTRSSNWATTTVNGVLGYWVRARVTVVSSGTITPPQEVDLHPFIHRWPFVDIPSEAIRGDIPALISMYLDGIHDGGGRSSGFYVGLRTYHDRGEQFTAYINISDYQPTPLAPAFSITTPDWQNNVLSATGRCLRGTIPGGGETYVGSISLNSLVWNGRFRVFLKISETAGNLLTDNMRITLTAYDTDGSATDSFFSGQYDIAPTLVGGNIYLADFGEINIGQPRSPNQRISNAGPGIRFNINMTSLETVPTAGDSLDFIEMIMMPTDEWFGYFFNDNQGYQISDGNNYEFGSAFDPKLSVRSALFKYSSNLMLGYYTNRQRTSGETIAQPNTRQRYWFAYGSHASDGTSFLTQSPTMIAPRVFALERFLGSRGEEPYRLD